MLWYILYLFQIPISNICKEFIKLMTNSKSVQLAVPVILQRQTVFTSNLILLFSVIILTHAETIPSDMFTFVYLFRTETCIRNMLTLAEL
jgi:hypothetical protein